MFFLLLLNPFVVIANWSVPEKAGGLVAIKDLYRLSSILADYTAGASLSTKRLRRRRKEGRKERTTKGSDVLIIRLCQKTKSPREKRESRVSKTRDLFSPILLS